MNVLEFARRSRRLTQGQVAERTGISQTQVSAYERGMRPSPDHLHALAGFFDVPAVTIQEEVPTAIALILPAHTTEEAQG